MARSALTTLQVVLCLLSLAFATTPLISSNGQSTTIPTWKLQSSSKLNVDISKLSSPSLDTSSWYTLGSHGTLMAALLESNAYKDTDLFYSANLQKVDYSQFQVPWFYRSEFALNATQEPETHFLLSTNGVTSRADVYINGKLVADKNTQAGAYAGHTFSITDAIKDGTNILLIRVYPTNYDRDLALGFVDWNPYPPDNGTGIWRDIDVTRTGAVSLSAPRAISMKSGRGDAVNLSLKVDMQNLESKEIWGEMVCTVTDPAGKEMEQHPAMNFTLPAKAAKTATLNMTITSPQIWWPAQWGSQSLYSFSCVAYTTLSKSAITTPTKFGIRTVTSTLSATNDTTFFVNEKPFQVLGAGYTSDIFLRFDIEKLRAQFKYMLSMGLNTVRLEGKQEHPALYSLADEMGLMVMAGWECCDKWEGWAYNDEGSGQKWTAPDYTIANASMRHEAAMMTSHPSTLAFLVGSDFWPDDKATKIYVSALQAYDWQAPIIASASQRGFPSLLGNGGMKMDGPYDWVPPNYWYGSELGAAFGFGSELGAGVGTPELSSLKKFLSSADLADLWKAPNKGLYHMSTNVSSFYTREIYNTALWKRYGAPTSLPDYLLKAQMADYEATRAEFEAYAAKWSNPARPATGLIYWMLNNAWPSLHWSLFDYYLHPAGSYFGTKTGSRIEHVAYDYADSSVYLINRSLDKSGPRTVEVELLSLSGSRVSSQTVTATTAPNHSKKILDKVPGLDKLKDKDTALLRLLLKNGNEILSRNVYWLSPKPDVLDWRNSTWYSTPVTSYTSYTALNDLESANVAITSTSQGVGNATVCLENKGSVPAVFVKLNLVDAGGKDVVPVFWEDNYVTLFPQEKIEVRVEYSRSYAGAKIEVLGRNVGSQVVEIGK
ncbi:glycoside hydrolase [Lindgomyces ingoldianus]|uniref:Glycoside hydrolase n=1 Tax=Lindgomyces ingoldianus TaxID=673940 RepID=A0ACB6QLV5_9PLEO|nr:glycoside hydrolase [Lindgomyces ingoldianus]KAF2467896.1 glycoside hydrolase [Lindgomyces ingoldianus]